MSMEEAFDLSGFSGFLPLFPLPNLVLFPGMLQPLHIFEERYREMLRFVQESERLIGMVLLRPGWNDMEANKDAHTPPIYSIACLGRVMAEEKLQDGRSNILLLGLARVAILDEVDDGPFRIGRVALLQDQVDEEADPGDDLWQDRLLALCHDVSPELAEHISVLVSTGNVNIPLGSLADSIAAATDMDGHEKQRLLEELDVQRRAEALQRLVLVRRRSGESTDELLPPGADRPIMN